MGKKFLPHLSVLAIVILLSGLFLTINASRENQDRRSRAATTTSCTGIQIAPGQDIQAAINANPENTVFCLGAGTFRLTSKLTPKKGQQFIGATDTTGNRLTILTGAKVLTDNPTNVTWTSLVNATTNNGLVKTSGIDGRFDAGAVSSQQIASGSGYAEITITGTLTDRRFFGLNHDNRSASPSEVDYGIEFSGDGSGRAFIYENGTYKTTTTYAINNVFRIALENGAVKYYKNGTVSYSSTQPPVYPLFIDASIGKLNASIANAKISINPWIQDGNKWYMDGQTQRLPEAPSTNFCQTDYPRCYKSEDTFYDDKALKHVASVAAVVPGTFYFDYDGSRIYIGDNPAGHKVETATADQAFEAVASTIVIKNLVIEKFGSKAHGPGTINQGNGGKAENNEIRLNHGAAIRQSSNSVVKGNFIHHNGNYGVNGAGFNLLFENNEVAFNNTAGVNPGDSGGSKWVYTDGLIVRGNYFHDNYGVGIWIDINNINTLFENNRAENNKLSGILSELSYKGIFRNNILKHNNYGLVGYSLGYGGEITLRNSQDYQIYGNTVTANSHGLALKYDANDQGGTTAKYGPWITKNNTVHDNTFILENLAQVGLTGSPEVLTNNNTFSNNHYQILGNNSNNFFAGANKTWSQWQAAGYDTTGTYANCFTYACWINTVNATANGNTLTKTAGTEGFNAGATSLQQLPSGNGYAEITITGTLTDRRFFGLNHDNRSASPSEVDYGIEFSGDGSGRAFIYENGVYKKATTYAIGNSFKIAVESGVVKYYKNGSLLYTSTQSPVYPLFIDASIAKLNASISTAKLVLSL